MFCENCGKKLNDNDKFCEGCGTPVAQSSANTAPTQAPVQEESAQAPVQPQTPVVETPAQPQAPVVETPAQVQQMSNAPVAPTAPVAPKEKKPLPKSAVLGIIIGGAAVALIAIVVCIFVFVLPMFNKIDVSKYVIVNFDEETLYDGYAEADVKLDYDLLYEEAMGEVAEKTAQDYLDDIKNGDYSSLLNLDSSNASVNDILDYCNIEAEIKTTDEATESTEESTESKDKDDSFSNSDRVKNIGKDDIIVVTITWSEKKSDLKKIEKYESELGVKFDRTPKTVEFNVNAILEDEQLVLEEVKKVDVLGYIADNNLTTVKNFKDGDLEFMIAPFEFEAEGYTFKYKGGETYSSEVDIYEGDKYVENISFKMTADSGSGYSYVDDLSNGDTVTVEFYGGEKITDGLFLTTASKDFTVTAPTPITAEEAKTNIETIKTTTAAAIEAYSEKYKNVEVVEAYYLTPTDTKSSKTNLVVVYAKCKYTSILSSYDTYYVSFAFEDSYMDNGVFKYSDEDYTMGDKTLDYIQKHDYYVTDTKDYKATKVS